MFAHAVGSGQFPVPLWALGYATAALMALAALAVRQTRSRARAPWPREGPAHAAPSAFVTLAGRALGVLVWAVTVTAAFVGPDDSATNITYYAVLYGLFLGAFAVSLTFGDVWRHVDPFPTLATLVGARDRGLRDDGDERPAPPTWTAPVLLASFAWVLTALHLRFSPRAIGVWLVAYSVAVLVGALVWGRGWLRRGEGFAVLFDLVGRLAPLSRRRLGRSGDVDAGGTGVVVVVVALAVFAAVRELVWWQVDVVGARSGWSRTLVDTAGLAFVTAVVAVVWTSATRAAAARAGGRDPWGASLVLVAAGLVVAKFAALCVADGWNLVALASDPYGRGWDLFGTYDWFPSEAAAEWSGLAWVEVLAIVLGGVAAVVVAQDAALRVASSRRAAARAVLPVQVALVALTVAGLELVLRG